LQSFLDKPGVAHIAKNVAEQCRSVLHTIMFGKLACDSSGALELGLFPASYCGADSMSDAQAALLLLGTIESGTFFL